MKKQVMESWVNALRSGDLSQCSGSLERSDSFCVLGVLSLLALTEGVCDYDVRATFGVYDGEIGKLPESVRKWAGLQPGAIALPGEFISLSWMNDNGYTFTELADLIEENYKEL